MNKIDNIQKLRDDLSENYLRTKNGEMAIPLCKELSNSAGKIISSAKVQMDYNKMTGKKDAKIPFLEV